MDFYQFTTFKHHQKISLFFFLIVTSMLLTRTSDPINSFNLQKYARINGILLDHQYFRTQYCNIGVQKHGKTFYIHRKLCKNSVRGAIFLGTFLGIH